jgi:hypothetical protein
MDVKHAKLPKEMKAICSWQPWAHIIIKKGKRVENRPRNSLHRGIIVIHATPRKSNIKFDKDCEFALKEYGVKVDRNDVPERAIVGFAIMEDVITKKPTDPKLAKWYQKGLFGYVLSNAVAINDPVECKGERGVWTIKGKPLQDALKQLTPQQRKKLGLE